MQLRDCEINLSVAMNPMKVPAELAARVLARVGDDPFFVGSALVAYQRCAGADFPGLAAFLGCAVEDLTRLALARRPDPHSPRFRAELARIAARTRTKEDRLAAILQFWHREGV